ncbi:FecR family protein [Flavihumibacter sp. UBA7668]|uniref:FecR family protein n=1 Tax=Flavihumibacter sp. UBA7668 TaxID=1946542 RepID=UPI0025B7ED67|nr:FecR family protein [Flavihumibacter sp. UBA7668]
MRIPDRLWILLAKKSAGEASEAELEELGCLLSDNSSSGYTIEVLEKIWQAQLKSFPEPHLNEEVWEKINAVTNTKSSVKPLFTIRKLLVAASLLVLFSVAGILTYQITRKQSAGNKIAKKQYQVSTQSGSKSRLVLPDGTQVWLNGNSELTYSNEQFGKENREVVLTGEAFFDVTKDEIYPFIIHAGPVNITVKGTAFNVKAYPKEKTIETSLVRGLVEVSTDEAPERKILLKPNEKIIIPLGNYVSGSGDSLLENSHQPESLFTITKLQTTVNGPPEIAWTKPQLIFDNEALDLLAPKMESWFNIRIYFKDKEIQSKRFSGVIEKESLKETLEAMQLSGRFNYEIKETDLWIWTK